MAATYATANNYGGGHEVDPARALNALTSAALQLVVAMHLAGWNFTVAVDPNHYGNHAVLLGGVDPETRDRVEFVWTSRPNRSRRRGWTPYRLTRGEWYSRGTHRPARVGLRQATARVRMDTTAGRTHWHATFGDYADGRRIAADLNAGAELAADNALEVALAALAATA